MPDQAKVIIVLSPPSMTLRFKNLGAEFPWVLSGLKANCGWMRWDKIQRVWKGESRQFGHVLRYCRTVFASDQITVRWSNDSTGADPRQQRMF